MRRKLFGGIAHPSGKRQDRKRGCYEDQQKTLGSEYLQTNRHRNKDHKPGHGNSPPFLGLLPRGESQSDFKDANSVFDLSQISITVESLLCDSDTFQS